MSKDEIWRWSAAELSTRIASREVSAREATLSAMHRLEQVNGHLNAVVATLGDEALEAADQADALLDRGIRIGPLHGIPVTTKINVDQKGCATSNGVVAYGRQMALEDSPPVANWRQAGAIIFGRTNTPAFSWRWFTDNDLHGRTLNPWDGRLTPGGSSGGSAASVAAGIGQLAHANDLGGSIRYPAYCCGVPGIRPTIGRVPAFNPSAEADRPFSAQLFGAQGVIARSVRDVRLGLLPMAHGDHRDPLWVPAPWSFPDAEPVRRVALFAPLPQECDVEVLAALDDAERVLAHSGYVVERKAPPSFEECATLWQTLVINEVRQAMFPEIEKLGDETIRVVARTMGAISPEVDLEGFSAAWMRRNSLLRAWQQFLRDYPVIVMPVSLKKPMWQDADQVGEEGMSAVLRAQSPLLALVPLGLPALVVPMGMRGGAPSGVQVVASRFREDLCFEVGEHLETAFPCTMAMDSVKG